MANSDGLDFELDVAGELSLPDLLTAPGTRQAVGEAISQAFAGYLEHAARALPTQAPAELRQEAVDLTRAIQQAADPLELIGQLQTQGQAWRRLMTFYADQAEMAEALGQLLHTVLDNLGALAGDQWVTGQVSAVRQLIEAPLDARQIVRAEQRLQSAAEVQSALQARLTDARQLADGQLAEAGRQMEHVSQVADSFQHQLDDHAVRVHSASDISELAGALTAMLSDTQAVRQSVRQSRDELVALRNKARAAEAEVARLQEQLAEASLLARHDPLTGVLNRKGLEDAFAREQARMDRRGTTLCLALIDIDNFKSINDQLGHAAGDEALVHLATVAKAQLRASDTLGRFGGEEFIILMPDTELPDAEQVLLRVQRALTREIFMSATDKRLITFSAGVTAVQSHESQTEAQERADGAMYQAKRTGKNRVVCA